MATNFIRAMFTAWSQDAKTIRCAACRATNLCSCHEKQPPSTTLDAVPSSDPTAKFKQHCELNPWALECKIFED